ncbi:MAG: low affinity iron permease family protein [Mycobacterium sp.]
MSTGRTPTDGTPHPLTRLLNAVTQAAGSRWVAVFVTLAMLAYLAVGAVTGFGKDWHLWIHSTGALVTLPMLFILQHTANRENRAILIKLDELISASTEAEDDVIDIEEHEVDDQEDLRDELQHDGGR